MVKKIFLLCILLYSMHIVLIAQSSLADTIIMDKSHIHVKQKLDSINSQSFIAHKTDLLIGSIFGYSKQLSNADSIINKLDAEPSFGIYKNNYFIVGSQLLEKSTRYNSDVKFQLSIKQRLTNSTLPFKTHLFFTYTQKAFWDVFRESLPFRDLNFNPSIGLGKALVRNNRLLGTIAFQFEHESNGRAGLDSRSWNKVSFGSYFTLSDLLVFQAKAWIPIVDGGNNKDIVRYAGWGLAAIDYISPNKKYNVGCVVVKRGGVNLNANIILNFSARMFSDDNQYLFLEYYSGYAESLLEYNEFRQRLRIGIVFKSNLISIY